MVAWRSGIFSLALAVLAMAAGPGTARGADLTPPAVPPSVPVAPPSAWTYNFTPYGWISWLDGKTTIKGRDFDLYVTPKQLLDSLEAAWFSYMEARNGPISVFADVVYANLSGSGSGIITRQPRPNVTATLGASVGAGLTTATIELGGSYELFRSGGLGPNGVPTAGGVFSLEALGGVRYWRQATEATVKLKGTLNIDDLVILSRKRVLVGSGSVDWVDPFVGARAFWEFMPGQKLQLRGDIGGFGIGSQLSWQAMATYNANFATVNGVKVDAYLGFRALSVDYTQGSGNTRYRYDAVQYGPVTGVSMRF
jgi:hypothetical protein